MIQNSWLNKYPIAHRGLHSNNSEIPENSIISFNKALKKNIPIEIDVQLSKDNEVIVFHDFDLLRMCSIEKKISELTLNELKLLNLHNSKEKIPTLKETLELINGQIPILIELKNEGKVGDLESRVNQELINYNGEFAIQSFNPFSLNWFRKNNSKILRGQLTSNFEGIKMPYILKFILKKMLLNFLSKPDFISIEISSLPNSKIEKKYKNKALILGWTIDNNEKQIKAKKLCDNYIFELIDI